ncbi:polysaccharide biosynthesis/export family protein [Sphingomonas sp.]|uniref:polysaccharide biosynthesis/export family protein n=1 Tax=Sphingomonas sp. TaxID=28214 RepID=UPI00180D68C7|nr:polysaccharide biosynthesis/export family protein [Sphingomonas sp.]MBA3511193.1 polysaccharide export protein [Sphingomonas sp.]
MRNPLVLLIACLAAGLAGCSSNPMIGPQSSAVTVSQSLPPPDQTGMALDLSNYRIGPLDVIRVEIFGAPELTREAEVDAAGNFSVPLAGPVQAAGRSPAELSDAIAERLRGRYLKSPQVSVNIVKAQSKTFTVDGAVRQPGNYAIVGKMTLQQAIATARGADEAANLNNVVIFRTVNNRKAAALYSLKAIRAGQLEDPQIYGNDIVVVGESAARKFLRDFGNMFPVLGQFVPVL